jgi:hypothetical protein
MFDGGYFIPWLEEKKRWEKDKLLALMYLAKKLNQSEWFEELVIRFKRVR